MVRGLGISGGRLPGFLPEAASITDELKRARSGRQYVADSSNEPASFRISKCK
jgi:hypothetical protein